MTDAFEKMGPKEAEQFARTLKDGGLEAIAKDNAEKAIALNERFHKMKQTPPAPTPTDPKKKAEFKEMQRKNNAMRAEWMAQFKPNFTNPTK